MWQAGGPSNRCIKMHSAGQLSKARGTDDERCTDLKPLPFQTRRLADRESMFVVV